jgi:hypothetical protein
VSGLGQVNQEPFDRLTAVHAAIGTFYGLIRVPWWWTLSAAAIWEVVEYRLKQRAPELFAWPTQDSPVNAVMDIAVTMGGWSAVELARQYRTRRRREQGLPPLRGRKMVRRRRRRTVE